LRQQKGRFDDEDAEDIAKESNRARAESKRGHVRYGFYTGTIVLFEESETLADARAREVKRLLTRLNFASRIETLNAEEAFLGLLARHGYQNVRRPIARTDNLAHTLPL
jgi:type IV secretion system protein VirB4